jgi:hypothetical protein
MMLPYLDAKYSTLGTSGFCFQASVFLNSSKHANPQTGWQGAQSDLMNSLHVDKEIKSLWLRSTLANTGYTQWMLSILYPEKLLPSLQWMAAFRNTRNCGIPWNTREGHSFLQRFSEGQNNTTFLHGTEHIQTERLKAVPQSDFGNPHQVSTNQWMENWKRNITQTTIHTNTHIISDDILIVI